MGVVVEAHDPRLETRRNEHVEGQTSVPPGPDDYNPWLVVEYVFLYLYFRFGCIDIDFRLSYLAPPSC